ncbi:MAG: sensor histidine kinase, partial [Pirellulaceae bacterium]|nr:sensor histidine kinase [Pirellulaceae bacterium]
MTKLSPEQEIALLKEKLQQAQNLTALGELLGTTTHEFNNVLMTILNYSKLGLRYTDTESRDKYLAKILKAAERASKITNTVLSMARNRGTTQEPTDLTLLLN